MGSAVCFSTSSGLCVVTLHLFPSYQILHLLELWVCASLSPKLRLWHRNHLRNANYWRLPLWRFWLRSSSFGCVIKCLLTSSQGQKLEAHWPQQLSWAGVNQRRIRGGLKEKEGEQRSHRFGGVEEELLRGGVEEESVRGAAAVGLMLFVVSACSLL